MKTVVYDKQLHIEAYYFEGIRQSFPSHFHKYYVIGFIENGQRYLCCKNREYIVKKGDIVLFHTEENHSCMQSGEDTLCYRGFHIHNNVMLYLTEKITNKKELPQFSQNVIHNEEIAYYFITLHKMIMNGTMNFVKEEFLLLLFTALIQNYGEPFQNNTLECRKEIEKVCEFIQSHYTEHICLEQICHYAKISKSTLIRAFTKQKGITPYRYLENIRINEAKKLLSEGVCPIDAAIQMGFSDQSHFTNYFSSFIGISPGVYRDIFYNKNKNLEGVKQ
ncbi:AraC family transcriptional regulator [Clostridium sp. MD294]|uniref:AraC family transcriptional regulator n=1 Tax=Clostridium sp. MD294 TaxID=97138 RepID=UPI0002CAF9CD|nr:AraC family transcriptional regulator [Clostridium sp. MD294]NDO45908.1 AraC family transcriptional regulator [Clostridium sp. MD294]USF30433.1 HTH-type transcriptional activator RhaS [Clostridium sp. MD294]